MLWDGLFCVTVRGKSTDSGRGVSSLTYHYATVLQISSPPTFQPCRASCSLEAPGYSITEVNIKTWIPPTASLKKPIAFRGTEISKNLLVLFFLLLFFEKPLFLPTFYFDLCRSQTIYFITSDTYVKNVKSFIKTLFWLSALWVSELSNTYSCV